MEKINFDLVKLCYQEQNEKAIADGFNNYFFVGELTKDLAFWLEDKLRRKIDFQIGVLDVLYVKGDSFRLFDGKYIIEFSLPKKDAYKLKSFYKSL